MFKGRKIIQFPVDFRMAARNITSEKIDDVRVRFIPKNYCGTPRNFIELVMDSSLSREEEIQKIAKIFKMYSSKDITEQRFVEYDFKETNRYSATPFYSFVGFEKWDNGKLNKLALDPKKTNYFFSFHLGYDSPDPLYDENYQKILHLALKLASPWNTVLVDIDRVTKHFVIDYDVYKMDGELKTYTSCIDEFRRFEKFYRDSFQTDESPHVLWFDSHAGADKKIYFNCDKSGCRGSKNRLSYF